MEKIEFEFLEELDLLQIETDGAGGRKGRWSMILREWIKSGTKACKLTCANQKEKARCKSALAGFIKAHNLDWTFVGERGTNNVYVVRA